MEEGEMLKCLCLKVMQIKNNIMDYEILDSDMLINHYNVKVSLVYI